ELAVKLKELGFDEECFYVKLKNFPEHWYTQTDYEDYPEQKEEEVLIPLWQQAFDWFTRKGLHSYIEGAYPWFRYYINTADDRYEGFKHFKIEEAKQACLEKLIEICKNYQL